jgi:hypothetical protein
MADFLTNTAKIGANSLASSPVQLQAPAGGVTRGDAVRVTGGTNSVLCDNTTQANAVLTHFALDDAAGNAWYPAAIAQAGTVIEYDVGLTPNVEVYISNVGGKIAPVADIGTGEWKAVAGHTDANGDLIPSPTYVHPNAMA